MKEFVNSPAAVTFNTAILMKRGFAALALVLLSVSVALAQEGRAFEPEYVSVFYLLRPSGEAVDLERQTQNLIPKGIRSLLVIPGEKSPVRFGASDEMQFIVRVEEDLDKATATMQLFRFEVQHGRREFLAKNEDLLKNKIGLKISTEKYGSSSMKVVPSQRLAPGEYCLSRSTISQGFCFGVDAPGNQ
jgi:hypothetical protein